MRHALTPDPDPAEPAVVEKTGEEPGAAEEGRPIGADQPGRTWLDRTPLSACRREDSLLACEPEKEAALGERMLKGTATYVNPATSLSGCAKPAQNGEQIPPEPAQRGRKWISRRSTRRSPRTTCQPTTRWPS